MTNGEFIRSTITDAELAQLVGTEKTRNWETKIYRAFERWADSFSSNNGNMAQGVHGSIVIESNPSIWSTEEWAYPDGTWRRSGRTQSVAIQQWLSMQYRPDDWDAQ